MSDKSLPIDAFERRFMAFCMKYWVLCPTQEPLATEVAKFIKKVCDIAVSMFFKDCAYEDREDLSMDMFRNMWQGLPGSYDPEKCPEEVNVMWLLNRARMYATGQWSAGYGTIGCKYTKGKRALAEMQKDFFQNLALEYEQEHPEAVSHKVAVAKEYSPLS